MGGIGVELMPSFYIVVEIEKFNLYGMIRKIRCDTAMNFSR